jgi:hypothetical protein
MVCRSVSSSRVSWPRRGLLDELQLASPMWLFVRCSGLDRWGTTRGRRERGIAQLGISRTNLEGFANNVGAVPVGPTQLAIRLEHHNDGLTKVGSRFR